MESLRKPVTRIRLVGVDVAVLVTLDVVDLVVLAIVDLAKCEQLPQITYAICESLAQFAMMYRSSHPMVFRRDSHVPHMDDMVVSYFQVLVGLKLGDHREPIAQHGLIKGASHGSHLEGRV